MIQGGVTDLGTAKAIARKLYASYTMGGNLERNAMEKMMIDTYKILVTINLLQNKEYRPTSQDVGIYANILDFNGDGKITC